MLTIIGTPIGNLDDISYNQARALTTCDILLVEDTRKISPLFIKIKEVFNLEAQQSQKKISYYKEVEYEKIPEVLEYLEQGLNVGLISDAGMPLISDPGFELLKHARKNEIEVSVISGPTAFINAVILSGFTKYAITFLGFLPKKEGDIKKLIHDIKHVSEVMPDTVYAFYESPMRINETIGILNEIVPGSTLTVARELTKKFEEVVSGTPKELLNKEFKGEITLLLKI